VSDLLPPAIAARLEALMVAGYSGVVELHFSNGSLRVAKVPRAPEVIEG
jgi:hypothetical protein